MLAREPVEGRGRMVRGQQRALTAHQGGAEADGEAVAIAAGVQHVGRVGQPVGQGADIREIAMRVDRGAAREGDRRVGLRVYEQRNVRRNRMRHGDGRPAGATASVAFSLERGGWATPWSFARARHSLRAMLLQVLVQAAQ
jgi:hypothetical protein